jgi:membrane metallo-endopeptidase-like protein 1
MDHTADPCQDFFQFACGTWNKKHVIPEDRSSISTFEVSMAFHFQAKVIATILSKKPFLSL